MIERRRNACFDAVDTTLALLASQPECGVLYPSRNPSLRGVRMLPVNGFSNYLVFYRSPGMPSVCSTSSTARGICHGFSGANGACEG